jgi:O-antigen ligase
VGNVRRLLLAAIVLDLTLDLSISPGYRPEAAAFGALGGLNISATTVALAILYVLWGSAYVARVGPRPRPRLRASVPAALVFAWTALSVLAAHDLTLSLYAVAIHLQLLLLYIYVASAVQDRDDVRFIVTLLFVGVALQSLAMLGEHYVRYDFVAALRGRVVSVADGAGPYRPGGVSGSHNGAAAYLVMLLSLALSVMLTRESRWQRRLAGLAFGLGMIALTVTLSRGAWAGFVVAITILGFFAWRRGWLPPVIPVGVAAGASLLFALFHSTILGRLFGDDEGSAQSRLPLVRLALHVIQDHPLLGVGANNFAVILFDYATPEFGGEWLYVVHNTYLMVAADSGIGALLALVWFLVVTLRRGWQCWKSDDRFLALLGLGCTAAVAGHMTQMHVDEFNDRVVMQLLWLIASLVAAMHNITLHSPPAAGRALPAARSGPATRSHAAMSGRHPDHRPGMPSVKREELPTC